MDDEKLTNLLGWYVYFKCSDDDLSAKVIYRFVTNEIENFVISECELNV
jgi:hypothetical protein